MGVQEALEERAHMLAAAPYMNSPLPIMIPIYKYVRWRCPLWWLTRVTPGPEVLTAPLEHLLG